MSRVSAITSCYKSEKYLESFLKNVKKQSYDNFEVILELNDPSKEEINIVKKYEKKLNSILNVEISKSLNTMSKTWNNCINRSTGKYLCIWNVDDQRTKNSIELMVNAFDDEQIIDVVFGDYFEVKRFKSKRGKLINNSKNLKYLNIGMILGPFFMFKKDLINKYGYFDEQLLTGADYDFAMRILDINKIKYINKNLGYFLNEGSGSSTNPNTKQPLERTVVELRYGIRVLDKNLINEAKSRYDINNLYLNNKAYPVSNYIYN